jgi:hypothetical protein
MAVRNGSTQPTANGREIMRRICAILVCVTASVAASAAQKPAAASTYKGFISDKKCGKNIDPACNRQCFEEGETPVLVVDGSGEIFDITNGAKITSLPGAHVEIRATTGAKDKTLTVLDVKKIAN